MKTLGGISVFLPKQQLFRGQRQKGCVFVCLCIPMCIVHMFVHRFVFVLCESVCVSECKSEMTRAELWLSKLTMFKVNLLSRPPRSLFCPLAEPQFEPQRVHSVQVVSEQPLVSDKTQVLVQFQG